MQKIVEYRTPEGFFDADIDVTKEEWLSIVSDPEIQEKAYIDVLVKFLREPGHKSTCKALGKKYDCSFNYFNVVVTNFGRHVKKKLNRFYVENTNGTESFWNISMIGRSTKDGFEWTLRKELADALQEYLINDLIARYKTFVMSPATKFSGEKYKWELLTETKDMDVNSILAAITKSGMNLVDMPRAGFAIKSMLKENPDVLDFSQARGCELVIDESRDEIERELEDGSTVSYDPPRFEYPYTMSVKIFVDHPYFDEMEFEISDGYINTGETRMTGTDANWTINRVSTGCSDDREIRKYHDTVALGNEIKAEIDRMQGKPVPMSHEEQIRNTNEQGAPMNTDNYAAQGYSQSPAVSGSWVCPFCDTDNHGNFCAGCGAKRPS